MVIHVLVTGHTLLGYPDPGRRTRRSLVLLSRGQYTGDVSFGQLYGTGTPGNYGVRRVGRVGRRRWPGSRLSNEIRQMVDRTLRAGACVVTHRNRAVGPVLLALIRGLILRHWYQTGKTGCIHHALI